MALRWLTMLFVLLWHRPLQNRAKISGAASILIMNTTRTDSGTYRCEVVAPMDSKTLDEISIELIVQVKPVTPSCVVPKAVPVGKSASLHCTEDEGYPLPTYRWYKDNQILPLDPKTSVDFANSTYSLDQKTGTLSFSAVSKKDKGTYHCEAENLAGSAKCEAQLMDVYDINIAGIIGGVMVVILVLVLITSGICCAYKRGYFANKEKKGKNYKAPVKADGMDYVRTDDECAPLMSLCVCVSMLPRFPVCVRVPSSVLYYFSVRTPYSHITEDSIFQHATSGAVERFFESTASRGPRGPEAI
ncbi:junctional adhesion molecule 3B isoform X2 [Latimeria chalumnae]|uniref:junctional adhesion molecule 3B isoform X2 n=1 Tax=Latimeria chalumnae TaxID=7897 RepID=UPI00313D8F14